MVSKSTPKPPVYDVEPEPKKIDGWWSSKKKLSILIVISTSLTFLFTGILYYTSSQSLYLKVDTLRRIDENNLHSINIHLVNIYGLMFGPNKEFAPGSPGRGAIRNAYQSYKNTLNSDGIISDSDFKTANELKTAQQLFDATPRSNRFAGVVNAVQNNVLNENKTKLVDQTSFILFCIFQVLSIFLSLRLAFIV